MQQVLLTQLFAYRAAASNGNSTICLYGDLVSLRDNPSSLAVLCEMLAKNIV